MLRGEIAPIDRPGHVREVEELRAAMEEAAAKVQAYYREQERATVAEETAKLAADAARILEAERARWHSVVHGIADEVWLCDADGKMSLINLESITAMGRAAFEDKTVDEVLAEVEILTLDGKLRPAQQAPLLRSLRGEVVRGEEIMRHRQTGTTRYRQFSSAPLRDAAGAITGAVGWTST
jgi:PAS domain-containing protein